MIWPGDDLRVMAEMVLATMLARPLQIVLVKAFLEPAGAFLGTKAWGRLRDLSGGRLPALPWTQEQDCCTNSSGEP
jgi:hypothetical protein